jgi:putative nucleotidyltransferase with HDIG domain
MSAKRPRRRRWRRLFRVRAPSTMATRWLLGVPLILILTAVVLAQDLTPERFRHDYRAGATAQETLRAPRAFRYVDSEATDALRRAAASAIPARVRPDPDALGKAEALLDERFDLLLQAKAGDEKTKTRAATALPGLSGRDLAWALKADAVTLQDLRTAARGLLREVMAGRIHDDALPQVRAEVGSRVAELRLGPQPAAVVAEALRQSLVPNEVTDFAATARAHAEARSSIIPVEREVPRGYPIVQRGQAITRRDLDMLGALGLLGGFDVSRLITAFILAALGVLLIGTHLRAQFPAFYDDRRRLLLLALVMAASMAPVANGELRSLLGGLIFIPAGCMVIAALINPQVGLMAAFVESALAGMVGDARLAFIAVALGSSAAAVALVSDLWTTRHLLRASLLLAGANALLVATVGRLSEGLTDTLNVATLLGASYGVIAPWLALGAIHVLQYPFDIATPVRLLELSNPNNQPLLHDLLTKAPGTYHASLMVASLAEAAAQEVGADPLLCRVAAYYHDVGKLRRPNFFVENQYPLGIGNIHERLSPSLSNLVIATHVKDGVELARRHRLPSVVCDIIGQHHGTRQ